MQPLGNFEACSLQFLRNMGGKILGYNSPILKKAKEPSRRSEVLEVCAPYQHRLGTYDKSESTDNNQLPL